MRIFKHFDGDRYVSLFLAAIPNAVIAATEVWFIFSVGVLFKCLLLLLLHLL